MLPQSEKDDIIRLTAVYGGQWGLMHTRRLLRLIEVIGVGLTYDAEIVWLAAHLHDWGAYTPWARPGVDHAARSTDVAQEFLAERGYPEVTIAQVAACIATHHCGEPDRSVEAILLSDADGLDFLGVTGILRDFSKNPRELRKAHKSVLERMQTVPSLICLERTRALAEERLAVMRTLLADFEAESGGCY